ncbi:MAG: carbon storage regulator CsrA [Gemmatimonadales bacterium]
MLILGRKTGESIVIDGGVRVVVLGVEGGSVRLGIEAPAEVRILRGEIIRSVEHENRRATTSQRDWLEVVPVRQPA